MECCDYLKPCYLKLICNLIDVDRDGYISVNDL